MIKKLILIVAGLVLIIIITGFFTHNHLLLSQSDIKVISTKGNGKVYQLPGNRLLIKHTQNVFIANLNAEMVVIPSDYSTEFEFSKYSILLWPRNTYAGVIVGYAVKTNPLDGFSFEKGLIKIWIVDANGKTNHIEIHK